MEIPANVPSGFAICSIGMGVLYCFFGYRFFKIALGVVGFAIGSVLARYAALDYLGASPGVAMGAGIAGGLIMSFLFIFVYLVGIFCLGASFGGLVGLMVSTSADQTMKLVLIIVLAVIGGGLALLLRKHVIITATSCSGALSIVSGTWYIAKGIEPATIMENPRGLGTQQYVIFGCMFLIAALGMVVQYRVTGRKTGILSKEKEEE